MSSKHLPEADVAPAPYWVEARDALSACDPVMSRLIAAAGDGTLLPRRDAFFSLARSIVGQQVSVASAEAVWQRLMTKLGAARPELVVAYRIDDLRACGLSRQKSSYLISLAEHFLDGSLEVAAWPELADETVIARLVQVKGIGRWTAEMFLIFHLLRPDVLPVADIGVQRAFSNHYTDGERPDAERMYSLAEPWRPWRSVAVWYLWRSLDVVPVDY
ncbi:MAG: DNA-3-methyladenine glycosylase 2 family protein [Alphaproteobacteria bacterium]|nr:DNA-3-methyladenine glycosylase 2 family protein [Alphaproteobacteria bacterium]